MKTENIRDAIATHYAAIRAMDMNAWLDTYANDAVSHDPVGSPPHIGHDGLRQFFQGISAALETMGMREEQVFLAGSEAAIKWAGYGRGKNGRDVTFEGIDVFEMNAEGKIQTQWTYWDPTQLMADLQS